MLEILEVPEPLLGVRSERYDTQTDGMTENTTNREEDFQTIYRKGKRRNEK